MELSRHSDPDLTLNTYAHTRLEDLAQSWTVCPHRNCGQAILYTILPTSCPRVVSLPDSTGPWETSQKCVSKRPAKPLTTRPLSYPARIRTWKNRTKTCCDTVSPPGNRACSLATRCSSGKTIRRRKRRLGSSRPCTQGSRAERLGTDAKLVGQFVVQYLLAEPVYGLSRNPVDPPREVSVPRPLHG